MFFQYKTLKRCKMGFFDLFKKKSEKLTEEQVDEIEEKVEETQEKHVKDRAVFSDLKRPTQTNVVKAAKPARKKASKKKARKQAKKVKRSAKKKGKKRR